jgi:hypothetical protein
MQEAENGRIVVPGQPGQKKFQETPSQENKKLGVWCHPRKLKNSKIVV